ncbi:hypothetical protein [Macrococcus armenti]|uniref:hypothetical protein n=1 Tax=Macrococcus armenti TaxID=2875764 RepID=UPI001CCF76C5|nr:hypothetical protein [Macrococcus armenti]UBH09048.1 hypothetical protein LAU41_02435 [Macrococcus armenti]UBH11341.1 hypothetical protein LAU38_02420 [Macrococcus armenti]UBH15830.1 hypothetical protein LAU44_02445 [Macrococcus armenti]UBH18190.1 hypothetical protein LAU39_02455 [Macrococcus armenti]UBH20456.1 hypothetical protein LAU40_02445 [Macrococcus armenti]
MKVYTEFWKRAFDFKGESSVDDFKIPFNFHLLLAFLILPIIHMLLDGKLWTLEEFQLGEILLPVKLSSWSLYLYILIFVPTLALTIRRYRNLNEASEKGIIFVLFPFIYFVGLIMLIVVGQGFPSNFIINIILTLLLILPFIWLIKEWIKLSFKHS